MWGFFSKPLYASAFLRTAGVFFPPPDSCQTLQSADRLVDLISLGAQLQNQLVNVQTPSRVHRLISLPGWSPALNFPTPKSGEAAEEKFN